MLGQQIISLLSQVFTLFIYGLATMLFHLIREEQLIQIAGISTGATFNKELIYERGAAIGAEFRGKGANFYLGPSVGALGRKPRGGRNWEGFGSDPVLQAKAGSETIRGVQDQGVIATLKHLIGNEQELYRMYQLGVQQAYSSNIGTCISNKLLVHETDRMICR